MYKQGIEQLLQGELDAHLGYEKHERSSTTNARNGHTKKVVKTKEGALEINVPRDRDATFNPILVPKRKSMVEGIENVIVSLYAKGMTVRDIEEQISYKASLHSAPNPQLLQVCWLEGKKGVFRGKRFTTHPTETQLNSH